MTVWNMGSTIDNKQATKRNRYSVLASFYNFIINTGLPALSNPCSSSVIKKIFKRPQAIQWDIVDKEAVDEIIFRTTNVRNRLMLELMARGGMRVGEVLNLTPRDIQERTLAIQNPKSGRTGETVYVPRKILVRLTKGVTTLLCCVSCGLIKGPKFYIPNYMGTGWEKLYSREVLLWPVSAARAAILSSPESLI
jgi:integrase